MATSLSEQFRLAAKNALVFYGQKSLGVWWETAILPEQARAAFDWLNVRSFHSEALDSLRDNELDIAALYFLFLAEAIDAGDL